MSQKALLDKYMPKKAPAPKVETSQSDLLNKYMPQKKKSRGASGSWAPSLYEKATTPFFKKALSTIDKFAYKGSVEVDKTGYPQVVPVPNPELSRQVASGVQGFLPVIPQTVYRDEWTQEHPLMNLYGRIGMYALLSRFLSPIAPAVANKYQAQGAVQQLAKYAPTQKGKLGLGLWLGMSKVGPWIQRAAPRIASRSALWGGKELIDQIMHVITGKEPPSMKGLVHKPAGEALYGAVSGAASGAMNETVRIASQGGVRALWTLGRELMEDGSIDKEDMINISLNAVLGAAVEAIHGRDVTRAYKLRQQSFIEYGMLRKRIMRTHPEYTSQQVDQSIALIRALQKGMYNHTKYHVERTLKDVGLEKGTLGKKIVLDGQEYRVPGSEVTKITGLPTTEAKVLAAKATAEQLSSMATNPALLKAAVANKFTELVSRGVPVEQAMKAATSMNVTDLVDQLRVDGISANIMRPFEVPEEGQPEVTTRPSIPVEKVSMTPNEHNNYDSIVEQSTSAVADSVEEEKTLEHMAQGGFDALNITFSNNKVTWGTLPLDQKKDIIAEVKANGTEALPEFIDAYLNSHIVSGTGNIPEGDPGEEVGVFSADRIKWGKNPNADIRAVVSDMFQQDPHLTPAMITVQATKPGDALKIANAIRAEYKHQLHATPKKKPEKLKLTDEEIEAGLYGELSTEETPADKAIKPIISKLKKQETSGPAVSVPGERTSPETEKTIRDFFKAKREEERIAGDIQSIIGLPSLSKSKMRGTEWDKLIKASYELSPRQFIRMLQAKGYSLTQFVELNIGKMQASPMMISYVPKKGSNVRVKKIVKPSEQKRRMENLQRSVRTYRDNVIRDTGTDVYSVPTTPPATKFTATGESKKEPTEAAQNFINALKTIQRQQRISQQQKEEIESNEQKKTSETVPENIKIQLTTLQKEKEALGELALYLQSKLGRQPTLQELSVEAKIPINEIQELYRGEIPAYLGDATSDASTRHLYNIKDEEQMKGEAVEREVSKTTDLSGITEDAADIAARQEKLSYYGDSIDSVLSISDMQKEVNRLESRINTLANEFNKEMRAREKAILNIRLRSAEGQVKEIKNFIRSFEIDNDIYTVKDGEVTLKTGFLNLPRDIPMLDSTNGRSVMLREGPYRLVPAKEGGRVLIVDGDNVTVYPNELLRIAELGGQFTNEPNLAAGGKGLQQPFQGKSTDSGEHLPGMREYTLRLKGMLKLASLFGRDFDALANWMGESVQDYIKAIQDPKLTPKLIQEMEKEVHMKQYSYLINQKLHNDIRQFLRKFVEKDRKKNDQPITEQDVINDIDSWAFVLQHANAEIGAIDSNRFWLTDQGLQLAFEPGQIDGHPDSEQMGAVQAYLQATGKVRMPSTRYGENAPLPGKFNTLGLQYDQALVDMMQNQNTRPELLFWNMLPTELKRLVLYVKAEFENLHFQDMIDSGVMDRTNINELILRGYSNRVYKFTTNQMREAYYAQKYLGSTDLPHAKYRTYAEYVLAAGLGKVGAGLMPVVDYAATSGMYAQDSIERVAQMNMINALKGIENDNMSVKGIPPLGLITFEKDAEAYLKTTDKDRATNFLTENHYSPLKLEGLVEYFHGGFVEAWARNDLHDLIKQVYATTRSPNWINAAIKLSGVAKRSIMLSPYQYYLQIGSSPALWLRAKGAWNFYIKPAVTAEALWAPAWKRWENIRKQVKAGYGWKYGLREHMSAWDHISNSSVYNPKLLDAFMRNGLSVFNPSTVMKSLYYHDIVRNHPDHHAALDDIKEFIAGKAGMDSHLFNHIVAKLMYQYTNVIYEKLRKQGIDHERAVKLAVDFSNRTSGLLDPAKWKGTEAALMYRLLMFARDFTFSWGTQMFGATYEIPVFPEKWAAKIGWKPPKIGWKPLHKYRPGDLTGINLLLHADKTKDEMSAMTRYYRGHLLRVAMGKMIWISLIQYAMIRAYLNSPEGQQDDTITEDMQWAWMNWRDPGKFGMIRTPWRDHQGYQIYIDPLMFREVSQMASIMPFIGGNFGRWIRGKASVAVNLSILLLDQIDWRKQPVTDQTGVIHYLKRAGDVTREAAKMMKPTFMREDPVSSPSLRLPSNLMTGVGHPLKRSKVPVGKGESFEENKRILKAIGLKKYNDIVRKREARTPLSQGDMEKLQEMVTQYALTNGKEGISIETFNNFMMRSQAPGTFMRIKNQKAIQLFGGR